MNVESDDEEIDSFLLLREIIALYFKLFPLMTSSIYRAGIPWKVSCQRAVVLPF
jgi:hypothetical protein